jgi:hypothetical protein
LLQLIEQAAGGPPEPSFFTTACVLVDRALRGEPRRQRGLVGDRQGGAGDLRAGRWASATRSRIGPSRAIVVAAGVAAPPGTIALL